VGLEDPGIRSLVLPAGQRTRAATAKYVLTLVFILAGGFYVWARKDEFLALHWPSAYAIAVVAVAYVVNVFLTSVYNLMTARRLGANLMPGESFMLSAVVAAGNFLLPVKAGAGVRAIYMKKVHRFPVSYFASASLIFMLVSIFVISILATVLLFVIYRQQGYFRLDLSLLFPLIMVVSIVGVLAVRGSGGPAGDGQVSWLASFRKSMLVILREKRLVLASLTIVAAIFVVASVVWTVALREFAPEITHTEALLLTASQLVSGFVTLTPGAAGFQEVAALYVGQSFAATTTEIFAVLIWVRLVRIATAVLVAIPSMWLLQEKLRSLEVTHPERGVDG
jgi:uncharacterized membrane protein YbhN (UPF0104 family)